MTAIIQTGTDLFGPAKWIVDPTSGSGTHTTISTALTSASSGDTIFIRPGTYTENPTLKAGVNLTAFNCDSQNNVNIVGTCTFTGVGAVSISGIMMTTNSNFFLAVTGSSASIITLQNCYLNALNNTGISFTTSSASANINIINCNGNIGTTGIALFAHSSPSNLVFQGCLFVNGGNSSTASTISSGNLSTYYSQFSNPITSSSTGTITLAHTQIITSGQNAISLTHGGNTASVVTYCTFSGGTASAVSVSSTLGIYSCDIFSSNAAAITGAGTVNSQGIVYFGTSLLNNATTQTTAGTMVGLRAGNAPAAGFLGEQIRATVAFASAVASLTTAVTNITSIALTPGIWNICGVVMYTGMTTATFQQASVNTTSATIGTVGDNAIQSVFTSTTAGDFGVSIPSWRLTTSVASTTVFLIGEGTYTVGTGKLYGRISATRVG